MIVFSHLRWNFVFQRPQHLMTRFARKGEVWFFEEPVHDPGPPHLEISEPHPNVRVMRPHTPVTTPGFAAEQLPYLTKLLEAEVAKLRGDYSAWLYTPMALPLLDKLAPRTVIYDCMDELSAFRGAPAGLIEAERRLFARADLVFTGGPSLYDAKKSQHRSAHCFPSSVEAAHFAKGAIASIAHPSLSALPRPRLGFFGVIDERLDIELIAHVAAARPEWQICLVGPIVKIDPAHLPAHSNIHYYGQQAYEDLPRFLAGWDVCLLPFALNDSTRFISPTKTLEYMAAGKAVVSTPIADVARLYGRGVRFAATREGFVEACDAALAENAAEVHERLEAQQKLVDSSSWDATASAMMKLIDAASGTASASGPLARATGAKTREGAIAA